VIAADLRWLSEGRVFQVGIVVPDLRAAVRRYSDWLGLGPWLGFRFDHETVRDFTYRGAPASYSIDLAMTVDAQPQVELLEIHGEPSPYHGGGLHHLATRVPDLAAVTVELAAAGCEPICSGHGFGADGDGAFAYFDTEPVLGVLLECIEAPRARREPDFVFAATDA